MQADATEPQSFEGFVRQADVLRILGSWTSHYLSLFLEYVASYACTYSCVQGHRLCTLNKNFHFFMTPNGDIIVRQRVFCMP
jgi:hypothetical protein